MPFTLIFNLFKISFTQGYFHSLALPLIFYLLYSICLKIKFSKLDSFYLAFAFVFSSMFLGVAMISWSWYFSQLVATLFLLLSINEFLRRKRYIIIGLFMACVVATRATAGFGLIFFLFEIIFSKNFINIKVKNTINFLLPIILITLCLFAYNYSRFQNIFEFGYSNCYLGTYENQKESSLSAARKYGMFSFVHVPGNLYYSLISLPIPVYKDTISQVFRFPYLKGNPWGMSIFLTSPYLLYLFFLKNKDRISIFLIITILIIALPVFLYYGIGFNQFGYRYGLDFFPFLFLLFARNYQFKKQKLSEGIKKLILISAIINYYLFLTIFLNVIE